MSISTMTPLPCRYLQPLLDLRQKQNAKRPQPLIRPQATLPLPSRYDPRKLQIVRSNDPTARQLVVTHCDFTAKMTVFLGDKIPHHIKKKNDAVFGRWRRKQQEELPSSLLLWCNVDGFLSWQNIIPPQARLSVFVKHMDYIIEAIRQVYDQEEDYHNLLAVPVVVLFGSRNPNLDRAMALGPLQSAAEVLRLLNQQNNHTNPKKLVLLDNFFKQYEGSFAAAPSCSLNRITGYIKKRGWWRWR